MLTYRNEIEYYRAVEKFCRMRKDKNSSIDELDALYDSFVKYEISLVEDALLDAWLDGNMTTEDFSDVFLNADALRDCAEKFLEEHVIPHVEQSIDMLDNLDDQNNDQQ